MRVFLFITKSEQGGAQTHVAQLTHWLVEHGHEVTVMSQPDGWLQEETRRLGGTFIPNDSIANIICLCRLWKGARVFKQAVSAFNPDIVACHSTMAGLVGRFALRGRVPTVFTAHGWGFTQGAPALRRLMLPMLERLAGRFCERIICVSRNDLELAHTHRIAPDDKLALVYNGVERPHNQEIASVDLRLPRNDTTLNIVFVGRLAPPKNPLLLVRAFSRLPRELQNRARVTIIGNGPDRDRLQSTIDSLDLIDRIELAGSLPRELVLELLRTQADLFVLSSRWEGFPYSILEAMAAGVPVIASRVGGISEALEQGGGLLVEGDNLDALTRTLASLIADDTGRAAMGAQAMRTAQERFGVYQMCEKTFEVYRGCLPDKPKMVL